MLHLRKKSTSFTYDKAVFVESNYVIAITKLSDWLTDPAPVFQQVRNKTKTNPSFYANSDEYRAVCSRCDWSELLLWC